MKRIILIFLVSLLIVPFCFAAGRTTLQTGGGIETGTTTTPLRSESVKTIATIKDDLLVASSEKIVHTIILTGASAGDRIDVYDALSATGTPKFEVEVGVAKSTIIINIPGGTVFSTGIFVDVTSANPGGVETMIIYE